MNRFTSSKISCPTDRRFIALPCRMTKRRVGSPGNSPKKLAKLNILRLYRQGKTKQEIAEITGLSVHGVNAILVRAGVR